MKALIKLARGLIYGLAGLGLLLWLGVVLSRSVTLPDGLAMRAPPRLLEDPQLLVDTTYINEAGERQSDQQIFDAIFALLEQARELIVLDLFLFNHFAGPEPETTRDITTELTEQLIAARAANPQLQVILITDPINTVYGGQPAPHLDRLREAGVDVVITNLTALRDSNPSYSGLWRWTARWFGNSEQGGWLPNALGEGKITLRSYLRLLNFKANHRKTVVADNGQGQLQAIVTSANPHSDSSAHSNIALQFAGPATHDLLRSEQAVLDFSSDTVRIPQRWLTPQDATPAPAATQPQIEVLTEQAIKREVLSRLAATAAGHAVDLAMFYLADRDIIQALIAAQQRGAAVRVLLDPNRDAFGREKQGVPARPVAAELVAGGVDVRWCDTHGEQCHFKVLIVRQPGRVHAVLGSANFTRRNLDNYNLETDVAVHLPADAALAQSLTGWFNGLWNPPTEREFSVPYAVYADERNHLRWAYRFMEATGWSSF